MSLKMTCDASFAIFAVGYGSFFLVSEITACIHCFSTTCVQLYTSETVSDMLPNHLPWDTTCINTTYWHYAHRRSMTYVKRSTFKASNT